MFSSESEKNEKYSKKKLPSFGETADNGFEQVSGTFSQKLLSGV